MLLSAVICPLCLFRLYILRTIMYIYLHLHCCIVLALRAPLDKVGSAGKAMQDEQLFRTMLTLLFPVSV